MSHAYLALLRGINVGGKNKLPMKDLASLVEAAGGTDVSTFIQSGNVLFNASAAAYEQLGPRLRAGIAKKFGYDIPVVLRQARELAAVVAKNPFDGPRGDPDLWFVM